MVCAYLWTVFIDSIMADLASTKKIYLIAYQVQANSAFHPYGVGVAYVNRS